MAKPTKEATSGLARIDDAVAGKGPWITDEEAKAGIVELLAEEDASGKTKGTTKRLCGAAAKEAITKYADAVTKRSQDDNYDQTSCLSITENKDDIWCLAGARLPGDRSVMINYQKREDTWTLVGVRWTTPRGDTRKLEAEYEKLLATKCK